MIDRVLSLEGHGCFHSIFPNVKNVLKTQEYIRENLPGRMELLELAILKSGALKTYAFKFLIVLLLCYSVLLQFI